MRSKIKGIMLIVIFLLLIFMPKVNASATLDEIQDYTITIDMRDDGTMDMQYHVEWKVLNSTLEGPLEWVEIGIPNKHVDKIKAVSDNIKKIKYDYNYGDYIRIDFKKKYYEGETVTFDFSFRQSYMYTINSDGTCTYNFTPGWFDDIEVKNATIKWNRNSIKEYSGKPKEQGGYLVWSKSLKKGEMLKVEVEYYQSAFKLDNNKQATNNNKNTFNAIGLLVIGIIIFSIIISISSGGYNSYYSHRGFGYYRPYRYHHHHHHHYGGGFGGRTFFMCFKLCMCLCVCRWGKGRLL